MRIAVVGLGGVGGYIASNLTKSDNEIVGFARGEHLSFIKKNGIKIVEDDSTWSVNLDVKTLDESDGYFDIVLFCVKSYDLIESYHAIQNCIDSKSIILSFSNGVSNGDELRKYSQSIVLDACVYILSHVKESGVIEKKGKVFAAVFGGDSEATSILKSIFYEANLRVKTPNDIKTAIWKKYIFISAFATLTSFYNKSIGEIYEYHYEEILSVLTEIASVALTKGIDIFPEIQKSLDIAKSLPYDASTSMHLDYKNKKRVEIETLCGYIVNEAKRNNIQTPLMQKMYEELKLA